PTNAQLGREIAFPGQPVPRAEIAGTQLAFDVREHDAPRLGFRHAPLISDRLPVWSDHSTAHRVSRANTHVSSYCRTFWSERTYSFILEGMSTVDATRSSAPAGAVRLTDVERTFPTKDGARTVLRGVDIELTPGEIVAVVGPSGCGKSTLLRLVGGLDTATAGSITLDGSVVRAHDESTAIAFQEPRLLPWRTIAQNVALGLPHGTKKADAKARVAELLDLVG